MIERCNVCGNQHETQGGYFFGDVEMKVCPELPENMIVPIRKEPVIIHGPQGEVFESYRYVLAGMPTVCS